MTWMPYPAVKWSSAGLVSYRVGHCELLLVAAPCRWFGSETPAPRLDSHRLYQMTRTAHTNAEKPATPTPTPIPIPAPVDKPPPPVDPFGDGVELLRAEADVGVVTRPVGVLAWTEAVVVASAVEADDITVSDGGDDDDDEAEVIELDGSASLMVK